MQTKEEKIENLAKILCEGLDYFDLLLFGSDYEYIEKPRKWELLSDIERNQLRIVAQHVLEKLGLFNSTN